jgi:phosphohistidine phosphatase
MRRLIVMRHAKSSWAEPNQRDLDRPLNKRGRRAATLIGDWLKAGSYRPDLALVSSARRAQETWAGVVASTGGAETTYLPELYHAEPRAMLAALRQAPDVETVLMLAHQPGIGPFAARLLADPPEDAEFAKYPTAATAVIEFDLSGWEQADWGTGRLAAFVVPRALE